jgi:ribonuclease HI
MNQLFCDGGVIGLNPSPIGGTWAIRLLMEDSLVHADSGILLCGNSENKITNNITEMLALVHGLESLTNFDDWTVYSDSLVTIGRASMGWQWNHMPLDIVNRWKAQVKRLENYSKFKWVNLEGHPTKADLAAGISKNGRPVHLQNKLCDKECTRLAVQYLKEHFHE